MNASSADAEWPPRSPREALLSSPKGRRKYQERRLRTTSPSPLKRTATAPTIRAERQPSALASDGEDNEDEETLQLQLQAIEAKLKLKKLQSKKTKPSGSNSENEDPERRTASRARSVLSSRRPDLPISPSKSLDNVNVPASPERRRAPEVLQRSPGRVLLGIDKGLSARNVSLKRAPSQKESINPFGDARNVRSGQHGQNRLKPPVEISSPGKSFSERMAEAREKDNKKEETQARLRNLRKERSTGFDTRKEELNAFVNAAEPELPTSPRKQEDRTFTREEVISGVDRDKPSQRSTSVGRRSQPVENSGQSSIRLGRSKSLADRNTSRQEDASQAAAQDEDGSPALFEPYSGCNLSRRVLPHTFIQRTIDGKTTLKIPDLLKEVKAPAFELPEELFVSDFVLFAIVASKTDPIAHKQSVRAETKDELLTAGKEAERSERNEKGMYMVVSLTDLKWTLDLFLFGTAFTQFRKLTPGTVIAILNPDIMPPPRHRADTGKFALKLGSSEDTVLEIGTAKDLAWCAATKKDGKPCEAWIDRRSTSVCEFHSAMSIDRMRSGRMEVQGMSAPFGPGGRKGSWGLGGQNGAGRGGSGWGGSGWGVGRGRGRGKAKSEEKEQGARFDRSAHSVYFMAASAGMARDSPATLIDAEDFNLRSGGGGERERQERANAEREKKLAEGLGMRGNGAGAEYLRSRGRSAAALAKAGKDPAKEATAEEGRSAASLGLVSGKAKGVMLSPLKRKRSGADAGVKKKTRFVTAKGIREAGRESLGMDSLLPGAVGAHEDDELDIV